MDLVVVDVLDRGSEDVEGLEMMEGEPVG